MAPLSQLQALKLAWSTLTPPMLPLPPLLEVEAETVPSSSSVHGSISMSGSRDGNALLRPDRLVGTRDACAVLCCGAGASIVDWSGESADGGSIGGWHGIDEGREGGRNGIADWIRRLIVSGNSMRSKSDCSIYEAMVSIWKKTDELKEYWICWKLESNI